MRKRYTRRDRFAAVENSAIDTLPTLLSVGLLTRLIRAQDGDSVTVETLTREYGEGRRLIEQAMRALVQHGYVVKFKVQSRVSDGERRGGAWWTTFSVDSVPFTREDVAVLLDEIVAEGNVRAVRVEPEHLDPRRDPAELPEPRPTRRIRRVGPTRENAPSGGVSAGGTDTPLTDGRSTDRRSVGGSYKEEDCSLDTVPSSSPSSKVEDARARDAAGTEEDSGIDAGHPVSPQTGEDRGTQPKDRKHPRDDVPVAGSPPVRPGQRAAVELLESLPGGFAVGPVDAARLAPLLTERATATGWGLGDGLAAELSRGRCEGVQSVAAVVAHRIRNLRRREAVTAASTASGGYRPWQAPDDEAYHAGW